MKLSNTVYGLIHSSLLLTWFVGCSASTPAARPQAGSAGTPPASAPAPSTDCNSLPARLTMQLSSGQEIAVHPEFPNSMSSWWLEPVRADLNHLVTDRTRAFSANNESHITWTYSVQGKMIYPAQSSYHEIQERILGLLKSQQPESCPQPALPGNGVMNFFNLAVNCLESSPFSIAVKPTEQSPTWYQDFTYRAERHVPARFSKSGLGTATAPTCADAPNSAAPSDDLQLAIEADLADTRLETDLRNWLFDNRPKLVELSAPARVLATVRTSLGMLEIPVVFNPSHWVRPDGNFANWVSKQVYQNPRARKARSSFEQNRGCKLDSAGFCAL